MQADKSKGAAVTDNARRTDLADALDRTVRGKNMIRFCPFGAILLVGTQP
jgi:hypothetical protein